MNFVSSLQQREDKGSATLNAAHSSLSGGEAEPRSEEWCEGLASALADDLHQKGRFLKAIAQGFVPSEQLLQGALRAKQAVLLDGLAYVVGDSIADQDRHGYPGISDSMSRVAAAWRRGVPVCIDFSRIRPSGSYVRGIGPIASGPVSYFNVFESLWSAIGKDGSIARPTSVSLRVDHPDIFGFLACFEARRRGVTTNRSANGNFGFRPSVALTDRFMQAVLEDGDFELQHPQPSPFNSGPAAVSNGDLVPHLHRTVRARDLWARIASAVFDGETVDIVFIDRANSTNNLRSVEELCVAGAGMPNLMSNNGSIARGFIQLRRFVDQPYTREATFNFDAFADVVQGSVELLDAVHDRTLFPLDEQQAESEGKRRIGLGFLGLVDAMQMLGIDAKSTKGVEFARMLAVRMRDEAYHASMQLAVQKGPFPMFSAKHFLEKGTFASTLPQYVRHNIQSFGVRNASILSLEVGADSPVVADWPSLLATIVPYFEAVVFRVPTALVVQDSAPLFSIIEDGWRAGVTGVVLAGRQ